MVFRLFSISLDRQTRQPRPLSIIVEEKPIEVVLAGVDAYGRFQERGVDVGTDQLDSPTGEEQTLKKPQLPGSVETKKKRKSLLRRLSKSKIREEEGGTEKKPKSPDGEKPKRTDSKKERSTKQLKPSGFSTQRLINRQQKLFKVNSVVW